MRQISLLYLVCVFSLLKAQTLPANVTYTYSELISNYEALASAHAEAKLVEIGKSDVGKPIHLLIISKEGIEKPEDLKDNSRSVVFINNGIHPGEACGINASFELAQEILKNKETNQELFENTVLLIIPVYNVGGMLNRGSFSRANQNGPKEYGFRGNAKNLDLNRDFIKCDSKNAKTFNRVFTSWNPDIFIDTHTTNGSDHQYTLSIIASQKDKLNPIIGEFMNEKMLPGVYTSLKQKGVETTPYVYSIHKSPDSGIMGFLETPRYSSGYAALFNCFSFITEAHVYKPFQERVNHTKVFLESMIHFAIKNNSDIKEARKRANEYSLKQSTFSLNWTLDTSVYSKIDFKGYEVINRKSEVTGQEMRFYDTQKPYNKSIKNYNTYKAIISVTKPKFYVFSQAYDEVINRLEWNKIDYQTILSDTIMQVEAYYIEDYKSPKSPYEAHFLHSAIQVRKETQKIKFFKGDVLVASNQQNINYLMHVMEPQSVDGFFAWNFFDGVLQQKEWFSDYAFEPIAEQMLKEDKDLAKEFRIKKENDSEFRTNNFAQLYYIYKRSRYFEKSAYRFPIYRIEIK